MEKYVILIVVLKIFIDYVEVKVYLDECGVLIVIKVDGFVVGKGVIVVLEMEEVVFVLKDMMLEEKFGDVFFKVVIEDFLVGEEFLLMVFVNGEEVYLMVIV